VEEQEESKVKWNPRKWPLICTAGILVILFYCVFTFTSVAVFLARAPFNPVNNWLSDLGNSSPDYNPSGAVFYNVGCILTGLALFPFYAGLYKWYTDERWRKALLITSQAVGVCSGFALIMIGVFSENAGWLHPFWSMVFFLLNFLVLVFVNVSLFTHPKFMKPVGVYGFAVAAINLALVATSVSMPLVEWFTVFTALGFAGLLVVNTFKAAPLGKRPGSARA